MVRLGLCCKFLSVPIRFPVTTASHLLRLDVDARRRKLSGLCRDNARALSDALRYCRDAGIGSFRINSNILPVATHPEVGYRLEDLPEGPAIADEFRRAGAFARECGLRLTFHPDQFILLSSPDPDVTRRAIRDLEVHAEVSEWVGADVINIHGGGAYGNKGRALERVRRTAESLPDAIRSRLTFENDDRTYTPADLLPLCRDLGVPLVYDVHHHRCLADGMSVEEATAAALATWDREPLVHLSSPKEGWDGPNPSRHHDFIDPADIPGCWFEGDLTVEVEAKAKEQALAAVLELLQAGGREIRYPVGYDSPARLRPTPEPPRVP